MAQTFYDLLANGGGRVEFVFFISGLPWAVSTHEDVATALNNPSGDADQATYRKAMFGKASVTVDATTTVPAYNIPIVDALSPNIGSQTIKSEIGKGLTGGNWHVSISTEPHGITYTHRSGTIWGLEGLDVVPSDEADSAIAMARLSRKLFDTDSTLYFENDLGD